MEESKNEEDQTQKPSGPEPKKPRTTFNYFNAEFVKNARLQNPSLKSTDAFREAAIVWSTMTEN